MGYLLPAAAGKVVVDMSCGSGLFARRFAASGRFAGVVAADFSESMLQQVGAVFLALSSCMVGRKGMSCCKKWSVAGNVMGLPALVAAGFLHV